VQWRHFADSVQSCHPGDRQPCRGPELEGFYVERRFWLQPLS
jgi:hypothetical protein